MAANSTKNLWLSQVPETKKKLEWLSNFSVAGKLSSDAHIRLGSERGFSESELSLSQLIEGGS